MKQILFLALIALTSLLQNVHSQNNTTPNDNRNSNKTSYRPVFWEASLPGGDYMVALNRITSVSMHSYVINATYMIHEVVVDTDGNALARFYAIEMITENSQPNVAKNLTKQGKSIAKNTGKRVGVDIDTLVEKNTTNTHSKTIEYRVTDKNELILLFKSAKKAWREGRGRKFSIR